MSGSLAAGHDERSPHTHVSVRLSDGTVLLYHDPRRFGLMKLVRDRGCAELVSLGVDPLSAEFTPELLRAHCTHRKRPIKNILMDQRVVAGLGNIYVHEILFRAGVRPSRAGRRLLRREIASIVAATQAVLDEALHLGGSSISDYRDGLGRPGYFQLRLDVYGRDGAACPNCRQPIRARILAGRSSFYCSRCQA
jgi:formamidopyrimidine-DNA glycosylase